MTSQLRQKFSGLSGSASQLHTFRARSILGAFVVPKLKLLFTRESWSAQPYSINFGMYALGGSRIYICI